MYELFLNAGPLERVTIPKDRDTKQQKSFGFIVFEHEESVKFAYDLLNGVELHRSKIRLQNKTTGLGEVALGLVNLDYCPFGQDLTEAEVEGVTETVLVIIGLIPLQDRLPLRHLGDNSAWFNLISAAVQEIHYSMNTSGNGRVSNHQEPLLLLTRATMVAMVTCPR